MFAELRAVRGATTTLQGRKSTAAEEEQRSTTLQSRKSLTRDGEANRRKADRIKRFGALGPRGARRAGNHSTGRTPRAARTSSIGRSTHAQWSHPSEMSTFIAIPRRTAKKKRSASPCSARMPSTWGCSSGVTFTPAPNVSITNRITKNGLSRLKPAMSPPT